MAGLRYVVLHHTGIAEPHFDLLFELETGLMLAAVRCREWPLSDGARAERIADHRRVYLEYEGEISGGRGSVRRIASGTCEVKIEGEQSILLTLDSGLELRVPRRSETS
jgi:hypothetical protein